MMTPTQLAQLLRDQLQGELNCIGRLKAQQSSRYLTDAEKADLRAEMADEVKHATLLRLCLARYPASQRLIDDAVGADCRDAAREPEDPAFAFPDGMIGERLAYHALRTSQAEFAAVGDTETVRAFQTMIDDEQQHQALHRRILARLKADPEIGPTIRERMKVRLREGFHADFYRDKAVYSEGAA